MIIAFLREFLSTCKYLEFCDFAGHSVGERKFMYRENRLHHCMRLFSAERINKHGYALQNHFLPFSFSLRMFRMILFISMTFHFPCLKDWKRKQKKKAGILWVKTKEARSSRMMGKRVLMLTYTVKVLNVAHFFFFFFFKMLICV